LLQTNYTEKQEELFKEILDIFLDTLIMLMDKSKFKDLLKIPLEH